MKQKFEIGENVRFKTSKQIVKIISYSPISNMYLCNGFWHNESDLSKYSPSRTGKYRNSKGQFTQYEKVICSWCDKQFPDIGKHLMECSMRKAAQEQRQHFSYEEPDSKQRNYQKIEKLERVEYAIWGDKMCNKVNEIIDHINDLEKKIDELGRKV